MQVRTLRVGCLWRVADRVPLAASGGAGERAVIIGHGFPTGGTLEVALAPPAGMWRVDTETVDFSADTPVETRELDACLAPGRQSGRRSLI